MVALLHAGMVLLFLLTPPRAMPGQNAAKNNGIIARAGDIFITEKEFVERFEFLPGLYRHRKPQLNQAKLELLASMVAEKLLAQEASSRNLEHDSTYLAAMEDIRKLFARDELYRDEVRGKVKLTDKEIARGVARATEQRLVFYFYAPQENDARFIRSQIKSAADFDRLALDTSLDITRDTATVIFGDADPRIEDAAYRLRKGEISPVVKAGDGYYILRLKSIQLNGAYAGLPPDQLRDNVASILRRRKERDRLDEFVKDALKEKVGYSRPVPFKLLAGSLEKVFRGKVQGDAPAALTPEMGRELRRLCAGSLSDTAVVVGTSGWTLGELIDRLVTRGFDADSAALAAMPAHLNTQIRVWVQQELLAGEGLRRGLDRRAGVKEQIDHWSVSFLAEMMKSLLLRRVNVSDGEVWAYLQSNDAKVRAPEVQIRELKTATAQEMNDALDQLRTASSFEAVIRQRSTDPDARRSGGVTEFFEITERPPIGEIASDMDVGQKYGPLRVADGFVYFELLAKRSAPDAGDTTLAARKRDAESEVLKIKKKNLLDAFLAQIAAKRGYEIYGDRLKALDVTSIPMMTYRMLGFGGKMFAVPFVPRELDWMNVEPPSTPVLP